MTFPILSSLFRLISFDWISDSMFFKNVSHIGIIWQFLSYLGMFITFYHYTGMTSWLGIIFLNILSFPQTFVLLLHCLLTLDVPVEKSEARLIFLPLCRYFLLLLFGSIRYYCCNQELSWLYSFTISFLEHSVFF